MIMKQPIVTASLFALTLLSCPQAQANTNTTVSGFLKFDPASQATFFDTTVWTIAVVTSQFRQELSSCIADWYTNEPTTIRQRQQEILDVMQNFPDGYPTGVIIAVLQKKCGKFGQ